MTIYIFLAVFCFVSIMYITYRVEVKSEILISSHLITCFLPIYFLLSFFGVCFVLMAWPGAAERASALIEAVPVETKIIFTFAILAVFNLSFFFSASWCAHKLGRLVGKKPFV